MRLFTGVLALLAVAGTAFGQTCPTPTCVPGRATSTVASSIQAGIYSVRFGTAAAYTSGGYAEGYVDSSCTRGAFVPQGSSLAISINTGATVSENVRIYLDANNDGRLDSTLELVFASANRKVHTGSIPMPAAALQNTKLRLRICADLYSASLPGPCHTPEYSQTEDYYVQIGANTFPPIAAFSTPDTVTCSGTVSFTDNSDRGPTSWLWRFGDGATSPDQSPVHIYTTPGRYTVSLRVRNGNGADSITKTNYVFYNGTHPVAATCQPITLGACCGFGITRARLVALAGGTAIDNASAASSAGYEDFTCRVRGTVVEGTRYTLTLTTNPTQPQATKVWIDVNNNGAFSDDELVANSLSEINPSFSFLAPTVDTSLLGKPLRMRIISDAAGNTVGACTNPATGQAEDYSIVFALNTNPPVAAFSVDSASLCAATRTFRSSSANAISRYIWNYGDGTVDTGHARQLHTYASPGTYHILLRVEGPFGADTAGANITYLTSAKRTCAPARTRTTCCQIGIQRVQAGSIDNASRDASEGYKDFTCTANAQFLAGQPIPITVTTGPRLPETVAVYIDLDANGQFAESERVLYVQNTVGAHTGSFTPAHATPSTDSSVRMRVISTGNNGGAINSACDTVLDYGQVEDYAITVLPNTQPPIANFYADSRTTCDGNIQFRDSSQNEVTSYRWDFGDGATDTLQNPVHHYDTAGVYTVRLSVTGPQGSDTATRLGYITILQNLNLATASCTPITTNNCCGFGITNVTFGQINNTTPDGRDSYQDYSCTQVARLKADTLLPLSVTLSGQGNQSAKVWIDYNADGAFTTDEEIASFTNATGRQTAQVRVSGRGVEGRGLRMRVLSDFQQGGQALDACTNPRVGQAEDYAVVISASVIPPTANFGANTRTPCSGYVTFTDSSTGGAQHWQWAFGDGQTDTLQNPTHYYADSGRYTVTLIVTNQYGADTLVRDRYIRATRPNGLAPSACKPTYTAYCCNAGITSVTLNAITHTSRDGNAGTYQDFTCEVASQTLALGGVYDVSINTGNNFGETLAIYLDANNDGRLDSLTERIYKDTVTGRAHTGTVRIPAIGVADTALRLRIVSSYVQGPPGSGPKPGPCASLIAGQTEDYTVRLEALPPIARIGATARVTCDGTVSFIDSSRNGPTKFFWQFGDGATDTTANPVHAYAANGVYTVSLRVANRNGADSITRTNYISVRRGSGPMAAFCAPVTQNYRQNTGILTFQLTSYQGRVMRQASGLASEGYRDFSCQDSLESNLGRPVTFAITTDQQSFPQSLSLYLDVNEDGQFVATERVAFVQNVARGGTSSSFTIPATAPLGRPLRLRAYIYAQNGQWNQCTVNNGQAEDYTIIALPTAIKGLATLPAFELTPNPATATVHIDAGLPDATATTLTLLDAVGRQVRSYDFAKTNTLSQDLDLTGLPAGVYTVRLASQQAARTQRLVVR